LDINFNLSDAEIVVKASTDRFRAGMTGSSSVLATDLHGSMEGNRSEMRDVDTDLNNSLMLKRQREFDIDAAQAEWRVDDGVLVVFV
jgi:hypothetical protein